MWFVLFDLDLPEFERDVFGALANAMVVYRAAQCQNRGCCDGYADIVESRCDTIRDSGEVIRHRSHANSYIIYICAVGHHRLEHSIRNWKAGGSQ